MALLPLRLGSREARGLFRLPRPLSTRELRANFQLQALLRFLGLRAYAGQIGISLDESSMRPFELLLQLAKLACVGVAKAFRFSMGCGQRLRRFLAPFRLGRGKARRCFRSPGRLSSLENPIHLE